MKSLVIIPILICAVVGVWFFCLKLAGMPVHPIDAVASGGLVAVAALLGLLPILMRHSTGPADNWQAALSGTVIHLVVILAGAAILLSSGVVNWRGAFPFWLIASYWTSLFLLIRQLRQLALKAHGPC